MKKLNSNAIIADDGVLSSSDIRKGCGEISASRDFKELADTFCRIGQLVGRGIAGHHDPAGSVKWYEISARLGNAEAMKMMGLMAGSNASSNDDPEHVNDVTMGWLEAAWQSGCADAGRLIGELLVDFDCENVHNARFDECLEWQLASAEAGSVEGLRMAVSMLCARNADGDVSKAEKLLRKVASSGCASAASMLGDMYLKGDVLNRDFKKAVRYLSMAERLMEPGGYIAHDVCYSLGMLRIGMSVGKTAEVSAKELKKARKSFIKGAEHGCGDCALLAGLMCQAGIGGEKDGKLAARCFLTFRSRGGGELKDALSAIYGSSSGDNSE